MENNDKILKITLSSGDRKNALDNVIESVVPVILGKINPVNWYFNRSLSPAGYAITLTAKIDAYKFTDDDIAVCEFEIDECLSEAMQKQDTYFTGLVDIDVPSGVDPSEYCSAGVSIDESEKYVEFDSLVGEDVLEPSLTRVSVVSQKIISEENEHGHSRKTIAPYVIRTIANKVVGVEGAKEKLSSMALKTLAKIEKDQEKAAYISEQFTLKGKTLFTINKESSYLSEAEKDIVKNIRVYADELASHINMSDNAIDFCFPVVIEALVNQLGFNVLDLAYLLTLSSFVEFE
ncbi:hypothetical protein [Teredinibacter sp. KSP-S5-2]|uniref:hypothetical protein n=1 Tax=Teredinibacter sp. KSP-S5-2 TaxID=3034506 RepID=UPI002934BB82|nr:hypothetical protein [Teredinibacter sp. KSP-S5-2]WNO11295.1 hypothetical protein P5V12_08935 [Teredinibacter sp. KSP-S5-2]